MNKNLIKLLAVGLISLASSGVIFLRTSPDNSNSQSHHSPTAKHTFPVQEVEFVSILFLLGLSLSLRKNQSFKSGLSSLLFPSTAKNTNNLSKKSQLNATTSPLVPLSPVGKLARINSPRNSPIQQQYFYLDKYQKLKHQVGQLRAGGNHPESKLAPWQVDLEIARIILSMPTHDLEEVKKVLSQSRRLREWKALLSPRDYDYRVSKYIEKLSLSALQLQQWRQEESASEGQLVLSRVPIRSRKRLSSLVNILNKLHS